MADGWDFSYLECILYSFQSRQQDFTALTGRGKWCWTSSFSCGLSCYRLSTKYSQDLLVLQHGLGITSAEHNSFMNLVCQCSSRLTELSIERGGRRTEHLCYLALSTSSSYTNLMELSISGPFSMTYRGPSRSAAYETFVIEYVSMPCQTLPPHPLFPFPFPAPLVVEVGAVVAFKLDKSTFAKLLSLEQSSEHHKNADRL